MERKIGKHPALGAPYRSTPSERLHSWRFASDRARELRADDRLPPLEMACHDPGPPIPLEFAKAMQRAAFFAAVMGALFFALVIGIAWRLA